MKTETNDKSTAKVSRTGLDYEMRYDEESREFQIWTPAYDGATGAILGLGKTAIEAKASAMEAMEHLCKVFYAGVE